ncbi:AgmX/PglI C-terminal domain-containing protein [Marinimicrobium agarilyticum]|uniref:AgmX/PglI C-terminal domain-containing protein n=1 Tax=Marinimicrobium agarilyticum TaxID=306546 RepID=UPI00041A9917|nr:AgmX/PglI C-terminal domain-containing protein [Marinimicrobium agarilyticum]
MSHFTAVEPMALDLHLPWELDEQREAAFKRTLKRMAIPLLLLFVVVPWLPTFDSGLELEDDAVKRTQVLLDPIEAPEPEPVTPETPPPPKPEPKPVEPVAAPVPEPQPAATPAPQPEPDTRESVATSQGMDELSNQLSAVRSAVNVASMQRKNLSDNEGGEVARTERARLGREMTARSNGTVVDETVMQSDITALSAHQAAEVEGLDMNSLPASNSRSHLSGQAGQRDMESIRRTLERTKGNVYALYQRALQDDPNLTGEFTFKLVIEPNGSISQLTLLVSELGARDLEQQILSRIEQVDFGAMPVPPTVVEYRFVFLPS